MILSCSVTARNRPSKSRHGLRNGWRPGDLPLTRTRRRSYTSQGFDFLGFNVRRYSRKLLIKPGKAAMRRVRERLAAEMRALRGSNAMAVIAKLNPIIRGWAAYYRGVVSSRLFDSLDAYIWKLLYKWCKRATPTSRRTGSSAGIRETQQVQE